MNVLIIEDESLATQRIEKLVKAIVPSALVVGKLDSVKNSVRWLKANPSPDLILMDIQLADGISFSIFDQCSVKSPIIFTTAYDEYALKAFKVNSIDYIVKPIDEQELRAALKKFQSLSTPTPPDKLLESIGHAMQMLTRKYKERFVVKVGEHLRTLEINDILFFLSLEKTTFAQTKDGRKHILDFTLDQLENLLSPEDYFRINRKYIISLRSLQDIVNYTNSRLKLILKTSDDNEVIVARERVQEFKDWMDR
jgi:DNA-binding LytR/AlgR family response regulator